jgi:hypothetical protein
MKAVDRQKMCSHCDARIPLEANVCPYCSADLKSHSEDFVQAPLFKNQSLQESLASLYTPPYSVKMQHTAAPKLETPKRRTEEFKEVAVEKKANAPFAGIPAQEEEKEPHRGDLWAILLLTLSSNLFVLGLLQFFFSDRGFLRLEWETGYWFIYCLLAAPLFFIGLKKANALK